MNELRLVTNRTEEFEYGLEEAFFVSNTHSQNVRFKMLPYTATGKNYVENFKGVVSEFIRILSDKKLTEKFDITQFKQNLCEIFVDSEEKDELLHIIEKLFLKDGTLTMFDLNSYNYVRSTSSEIKMAQFLYTLFIEAEQKEKFKKLIDNGDSNILHRVVYEALPKLEDKNYMIEENGKYRCMLPYVKDVFEKDFSFLINNQELVGRYQRRMLEYYYMFYVTQLVIKLNQFEKANFTIVEKIYMTLSWEVTSQTRRSYEYGLPFIKEHLDKLFSHAITFEILAYNNLQNTYSYKDIDELKDYNVGLLEDIDWFINRYKEKKTDVDFSGFKFDESERADSELTSKVKELFQTIDYQFRNSVRETQNRRYYDNIVKFIHENFGKRRGRSGYSFNITENDIIMFVQVILGQNSGRIRLVTLFSEFEDRGLLFDRESKSKIVELLEKLNLLEKKSDSGDAQYVRSIL